MNYKTTIDGHIVEEKNAKVGSMESGLWMKRGILVVDDAISVLPRGTHAALDILGKPTKRRIVAWWKAVK